MFEFEENLANSARIKVIGVGGGGGNATRTMIRAKLEGVEFMVANTDVQALRTHEANVKIQLGTEVTRGLGAGSNPEVGRSAAMEDAKTIQASLNGADMVFITAGMGGGTGTGAAPVIAQIAKDMGALTVGIVTKPFGFEGRMRAALANLGLEELKKVSDSLIVIANDKLREAVDETIGIKNAFKVTDNILYQAVNGMSQVILNPGSGNDINADFADVKTIMKHKGIALMGIGKAKGDEATSRALDNAINSPLLEKVPLDGAKGILIHFTISPEISLFAIGDVMNNINQRVDINAQIIFGTTTDTDFERDEVKITIIATGFVAKNEIKEEQKESDENEIEAIKVEAVESTLDTPPLMRGYTVEYPLH